MASTGLSRPSSSGNRAPGAKKGEGVPIPGDGGHRLEGPLGPHKQFYTRVLRPVTHEILESVSHLGKTFSVTT